MVFEVEEVALELIAALRPLTSRIRARDYGLADQLARAASSVALNIGEGNYSDPAGAVLYGGWQRERNAARASHRGVVADAPACGRGSRAAAHQADAQHALEAHALAHGAREPRGAAPGRGG